MNIQNMLNINNCLFLQNQYQDPYDLDLQIKISDFTNDTFQPNPQNLSGGGDGGGIV